MHDHSPQHFSILIVEDDSTLNHQLAGLLQSHRYLVSQQYDGESALLQAVERRFDLVLMDVKLPGINGFEVLARLRDFTQLPVIMLTACGAEEERVRGFRCGADDYVAKPFGFTELVLRIEALLRRTLHRQQFRSEPDRLQWHELCLERRDLRARYASREIALTPLQFRLLWTLLSHSGETMSKPFLYQTVLEREYSRYDRSLDMHLSRIRRKLVDVGMPGDCLRTVHGKGYRWQ